MRMAILECRGFPRKHELPRCPPSTKQIDNYMKPFFLKRGWEVRDRACIRHAVTLVNLIGRHPVDLDIVIPCFYLFCKYEKLKLKNPKDKTSFCLPLEERASLCLSLERGIEVITELESFAEDANARLFRALIELNAGEYKVALKRLENEAALWDRSIRMAFDTND